MKKWKPSVKEIVTALKTRKIKHDVHKFSSGTATIDVWYKDMVLVIQVDKKFVSFNFVDYYNPENDSSTDEVFTNPTLFFDRLFSILK